MAGNFRAGKGVIVDEMRRTIPIIFCIAGALAVAVGVVEPGNPPSTLFTVLLQFKEDENAGFGLLDVPVRKMDDNISNHFHPKRHLLMINGGYFNKDFSSTGFCKINGKEIKSKVSNTLSGFVAIDTKGKIALLTDKTETNPYPTVLQSGPFVIDPGGKLGINSRVGKAACRTLLGETFDKSLVVLITEPVDLYDLSREVKRTMPTVERLLNLDGGPSTAIRYADHTLINRSPVRNYIFKEI